MKNKETIVVVIIASVFYGALFMLATGAIQEWHNPGGDDLIDGILTAVSFVFGFISMSLLLLFLGRIKRKVRHSDDRSYKQVIVMRKDLNMRKGKLIAQGAHASLGATLPNLNHPYVKGWLAGRFTKIAVYVNSEEELLEIHDNAQRAGLISCLITDSGFTEFKGQLTNTCVAVGPAPNEQVNEITGHLPLM